MGTVITVNDPAPDFTPDKLSPYGTGTMDWDETIGDMVLTFDNDLTEQQKKEVVYVVQHTEAERTITTAARNALVANKAWVNTTYPKIISGADSIIGSSTASAREKNLANGIKLLADQLKDNTQQNNALIRLVVRSFDGTD